MLSLIFADEFEPLERRALQIAARVAFKELGIDKRDVSVHVVRGTMAPGTVGGITQTGPDSFMMALSCYNTPQQDAFTVGHESVHLWQYLRGDLSDPSGDDQTVLWKGQRYSAISPSDDEAGYKAQPWEAEAHARHMDLFIKICKAIPREDRVALSEMTDREAIEGLMAVIAALVRR